MTGNDIIPRIKKKVSAFMREEKGTISKQSMASMGTFVGTIIASGILSSKEAEGNAITLSTSDDGVNVKATGSHSHHSSHSAHSNHSNHSNHSSHTSSDRRLKKDIIPVENALSKILELEGVAFRWKETGKESIGLIAQDVESVFPQSVRTDEKTGMKSVDYGGLVGPLIEAMREQQRQIDQLRTEVAALKARRLSQSHLQRQA